MRSIANESDIARFAHIIYYVYDASNPLYSFRENAKAIEYIYRTDTSNRTYQNNNKILCRIQKIGNFGLFIKKKLRDFNDR